MKKKLIFLIYDIKKEVWKPNNYACYITLYIDIIEVKKNY